MAKNITIKELNVTINEDARMLEFAKRFDGKNRTCIKQILDGVDHAKVLAKIFEDNLGVELAEMDGTSRILVPILNDAFVELAKQNAEAIKANNPMKYQDRVKVLVDGISSGVEKLGEDDAKVLGKNTTNAAKSKALDKVARALHGDGVADEDVDDLIAEIDIIAAATVLITQAVTYTEPTDVATDENGNLVVVDVIPAKASAHTKNKPDEADEETIDEAKAEPVDSYELVESELAKSAKDKKMDEFINKVKQLLNDVTDKTPTDVVDRVAGILKPYVDGIYSSCVLGMMNSVKFVATSLSQEQQEAVEFHKTVLRAILPLNQKEGSFDFTPMIDSFAMSMSCYGINDVELKYDEVTTMYTLAIAFMYIMASPKITQNSTDIIRIFRTIVNVVEGSDANGHISKESMEKALVTMVTEISSIQEMVNKINCLIDSGSNAGRGIVSGMRKRQAESFLKNGEALIRKAIAA